MVQQWSNMKGNIRSREMVSTSLLPDYCEHKGPHSQSGRGVFPFNIDYYLQMHTHAHPYAMTISIIHIESGKTSGTWVLWILHICLNLKTEILLNSPIIFCLFSKCPKTVYIKRCFKSCIDVSASLETRVSCHCIHNSLRKLIQYLY